MASGVFRHGTFLNPATTSVAFYRDGKTATVSVTASGTKRAIQTNGKPDASLELENRNSPASDEPTMVLAGSLPLAFKPDLERGGDHRLRLGPHDAHDPGQPQA